MHFFHILYDELIGFLGIGQLIETFKTGNYSTLLTLNGIFSAISPLMPLLLLIEIVRAFVYKKFKVSDYKIPFLIYIVNRFLSRYISIAAVAFCIGLFEKYGLIKTTFTWYWLIYGYIVWEFSHFIYHYFGHKVRLFWCLHSTHHASEKMNLSISYAHFFMEAPYADVIRTSVCILLGVNPPLLFLIMFIDGTWGAFIHIGENVMKDARLGFMNRWILTPSHHRIHHARNPLYMDTNFCNLLNIWDRIFGTLQPENVEISPEYGITRKINPQNFWDVYFGEFYYLFKDVAHAPGIVNKFLYIFKPPGWSHTGNHKTAKVIRKKYLQNASLVAPVAVTAES
jgi:sterol desaturase/sphingolipid hydroxylase (fatty acid hydroxylase superfamily)